LKKKSLSSSWEKVVLLSGHIPPDVTTTTRTIYSSVPLSTTENETLSHSELSSSKRTEISATLLLSPSIEFHFLSRSDSPALTNSILPTDSVSEDIKQKRYVPLAHDDPQRSVSPFTLDNDPPTIATPSAQTLCFPRSCLFMTLLTDSMFDIWTYNWGHLQVSYFFFLP
jgi:hypothetical protein